jgi:hypothetical protein
MDFNATSVLQIVALKFVNFRQVGIVILPGLYDLIYNGTLSYMEAMLSGDGISISLVNLLMSAHDS